MKRIDAEQRSSPLHPKRKPQTGQEPVPSYGPKTENTQALHQENLSLLVYAGTSRRRSSFLQHAFPQTPYRTIDGGDEPDIPDVLHIMKGKIDHVLPQIPLLPEAQQKFTPIAIVAADERTSVLSINEGGHTYLQSKGKPKSEEEVRETFKQWLNLLN